MSWLMPTPLLLVAGVVALVPLAFLVGRPVSGPRLGAEAFSITLGVIATIWLGWLAPWLLEQRW